jgi:hypothetical protein
MGMEKGSMRKPTRETVLGEMPTLKCSLSVEVSLLESGGKAGLPLNCTSHFHATGEENGCSFDFEPVWGFAAGELGVQWWSRLSLIRKRTLSEVSAD